MIFFFFGVISMCLLIGFIKSAVCVNQSVHYVLQSFLSGLSHFSVWLRICAPIIIVRPQYKLRHRIKFGKIRGLRWVGSLELTGINIYREINTVPCPHSINCCGQAN